MRSEALRLKVLFNSLFACGLFVVSACTPKNEVPALNTVQINTTKCRDMGMNLTDVKAHDVRSLMTCLNSNGDLQPYANFLEKVTDKELSVLLTAYNKHLAKHPERYNQALDLLDRFLQLGMAKRFYLDFQVLAEAGVVQDALSVAREYYAHPTDPEQIDPAILNLHHGFTDVVKSNMDQSVFQAAARLFSTERARTNAKLLGVGAKAFSENATFSSDAIVEQAADVVWQIVKNDQLRGALMGLSDIQTFRALTLQDQFVDAVSKFMGWMADGASNKKDGFSKDRFSDVQALLRNFSRPVICFLDPKTHKGLRVHNLKDLQLAEQAKRKQTLESADQFYFVNLNLLINLAIDNCRHTEDQNGQVRELTVSEVAQFETARSFLNDVAQAGHALAAQSVLGRFYSVDRSEYITDAASAPAFPLAASLVEALNKFQVLSPLIGTIGREYTLEDHKALSRLNTVMLVENLKGTDLSDWLTKNLPAGKILDDALTLSLSIDAQGNQIGLRALVERADAGDNTRLSYHLRTALASTGKMNSLDRWLSPVVAKIVKDEPEARGILKSFASSLVRSWSDSRGGIGSLIALEYEARTVSTETPFRDFMVDFLSDDELSRELSPILYRIIRDPEFRGLISFTGELAGRGELEKLSRLLVDLFRSTGSPGLGLPPKDGLVSPRDIKYVEAPNFNHSPNTLLYQACLSLKGSLIEPSGENLYQAMKCLDAKGEYPGLGQIADAIRIHDTQNPSARLMARVTALVSGSLIKSANVYSMLPELGQLLNSGLLDDLTTLLKLADKHKVLETLDPVIAEILSSRDSENTVRCVEAVLSLPNFDKAVSVALQVASVENSTSLFDLDPKFKMKLGTQESKVRAEARLRAQDLSNEEFEFQWLRAKREFEERYFNPAYYTRAGVYPAYSDQDMQTELLQLARDFLKFRNLEEMISAFRAIADPETSPVKPGYADLKGLDIPKLFDNAVGTYRVIYYYPGENRAPELRIVTPLDQMDILVLNVDTSIANLIPLVGKTHMGTFYQVKVAESTNLSPTLRELYDVAQLGFSYTKWFETEKHWLLANDVENFYVLQDMADNGELRLFQRIYQALYWSTPASDRGQDNPQLNQMELMHRPMKYIFMSRLVPILQQLREKGQMHLAINGLFRAFRAIKEEDYARLRKVLESFVNGKMTIAGKSYFSFTLQRLFDEAKARPENFAKLVATFFQALPVIERLSIHAGGIWPSALTVMNQPKLTERLLNESLDRLFETKGNGETRKFLSNILRLNPQDTQALSSLVSAVIRPTADGWSCVASATSSLTEAYSKNEPALDSLLDQLDILTADPEFKKLNLNIKAADIVKVIAGDKGLRRATLDLVSTKESRRTLIEFLRLASRQGLLSKAARDIFEEGKLKELIRFLTEHFKPVTVP